MDVAVVRVAVLMATFDGVRWLDQQVASILDQEGVEVRLVVSDDGSTDGTVDRLRELAASDPRVSVLPPRRGPRGVAANFMHLVEALDVRSGELVAFSDQDDLWEPGKLREQAALLARTGAAAVSSNVVSFDASGRRSLIRKDWPQRRWDYVFEAGGPGSTYLLAPQTFLRVRDWLRPIDPGQVDVHDWLIYALVRAAGLTWLIDARPTVAYRQHSRNVKGENSGVRAMMSRLRGLRSGMYRGQFRLVARECLRVGAPVRDAGWSRELQALIRDLGDTSLRGRLRVARRWRSIRRRPREGAALAVSCVLGVW